MRIRPAVLADLPDLYQVCLLTGDAGKDASHIYQNPVLLGEIFVGPYVALSPEAAFALVDDNNKPVGYVLGVLDTLSFEFKRKHDWLPELQAKYNQEYALISPEDTSADAALIKEIFHPTAPPLEILADYPSHGHIDIQPGYQGQGLGAQMMKELIEKLKSLGSIGVYLPVASTNSRALIFYEKLGFSELLRRGDEVIIGMKL
jgi:ribosomal protein S18 acetylase RimI-like enzyme